MKKNVLFSFFAFCMILSLNGQITIDGNMADWNNVPILSEPGVFPFAKAHLDGNNLYFKVKLGESKTFDKNKWDQVELYLDADKNDATGMKSGWLYISSGVDYYGSGTELYTYNGTDGADNWAWNQTGTISRQMSIDESAVEHSVAISQFSKVNLASSFNMAFPYFEKEASQTHLPANNWDFAQRKGFTMKERAEVTLTDSDVDLTSDNAYYMPFMKDDNISQYLDFQSGAYSSDNPLHWASWAVNLTEAANYMLKMSCQSSESGKFSLYFVDMATNAVVKSFEDFWYPENATMTENNYGTLDLSALPVGKYMVKMTNPTTWTTMLKVGKVTFKGDFISSQTENSWHSKVNLTNKGYNLSISTEIPISMEIYTIDGKNIYSAQINNSHQTELNTGVYIVKLHSKNGTHSRKIIIN
jgi:hypothetical protein